VLTHRGGLIRVQSECLAVNVVINKACEVAPPRSLYLSSSSVPSVRSSRICSKVSLAGGVSARYGLTYKLNVQSAHIVD